MLLLEENIWIKMLQSSNLLIRKSFVKIFLSGLSIWCFSVTLHTSACLEISGYSDDEVICSQGLSDCIMNTGMAFNVADNDAVDVQNLTPYFKLCCKDRAPCTLCMVIDIEITMQINLGKDMEEEGLSGQDVEDYSEQTKNPQVSVTVCYTAVITIPVCKKVEFMVTNTALTQQNQEKISMVIMKPAGVSFGSHVTVTSKPSHHREVVVPSLDEVCSHELQERVEECKVPSLSIVINQEKNQAELHFDDSNESTPSVCVQYENNGQCEEWNMAAIPLYSVTPCMCFQVWDEDDQRSRRSLSCPFNPKTFQGNVWQNVSMSVDPDLMNNHRSMLRWNLSAPCRLEGEVWPCHEQGSCREVHGFRQQLTNSTWRQNSKGHWEVTGVFEDINLQLSPCVKVKVKGYELDPVCFNKTYRWRWSLLIVCVMLLVCLTVLTFYLLHDFVKKCVWSWHHSGFEEIGRKCHVVLLSPPDVDDGVSESVCRLGSLLCHQGFNVSVDQWSRNEQCTLGPLPWLHSQLLEPNCEGCRVVLILTRKALERVEEWTHQNKEAVKTEGKDSGLHYIGSPYSDVFMASLCLIKADKQLGRAAERFLLVKFDSNPRSDKTLPELLQGLLLFQLPSQTQALLTELTGRSKGRKPWTSLKWSASNELRAKNEKEAEAQKALHCKFVGAERKSRRQSLWGSYKCHAEQHCCSVQMKDIFI